MGSTVTYNPRVIERATGNVVTGFTFSFTFTNEQGEVLKDVTERNLTYDVISKYGGIAVRIEAKKS